MKKWIALLCAVLLIVLTAAAFADVQWASVCNPDPQERLNLRAKPDSSSISCGQYYNGTRVQILSGPKNGWYRVRVGTGNGVSEIDGYMVAQYLAVGEKAENVKDARPRIRIDTDGEMLLIKDFYSGSNVGKLHDGDTVCVLGVGTKYLHIIGSNGETGMIPIEKTAPALKF